jgi:hypothetical protein
MRRLKAATFSLSTAAAYIEAALPKVGFQCYQTTLTLKKNKGRIPKDPPFANKKG